MLFLKVAYLFFGYLLIYAAVANHGRFAAAPWQGVLHNAYRQEGQPQEGGGASA
jgi:hypothetical protein